MMKRLKVAMLNLTLINAPQVLLDRLAAQELMLLQRPVISGH